MEEKVSIRIDSSGEAREKPKKEGAERRAEENQRSARGSQRVSQKEIKGKRKTWSAALERRGRNVSERYNDGLSASLKILCNTTELEYVQYHIVSFFF